MQTRKAAHGSFVGDLAQALLLLVGGLVSIRRHKACSVPGGDGLPVADWLDGARHVPVVLLVMDVRLNCGSMKPEASSLATLLGVDLRMFFCCHILRCTRFVVHGGSAVHDCAWEPQVTESRRDSTWRKVTSRISAPGRDASVW